jgi:uncharacterized protein (TIGR02421 family)
MTALPAGDLAVDRELAQVAGSYRFLLDVTPLDVEEHRRAFLGGDARPPAFTYRDLEDEPDVSRAVLDAIAVGDVEDATLGHLLRAKHREVSLQLDLLEARGTDDFQPLSVALYGPVEPGLLSQAEAILDRVPPPGGDGSGERPGGERVTAERLVALVDEELDHYRRVDPDLGVDVELRPDAAGVMVSGRALIVGAAVTVAAGRVDALLQHEVGTHLLTYVNGTYQPLRTLAVGLAGYEATQEALAVLAEHLVGGLTAGRLRQLAGRVVAVHRMVAGDSFVDVHGALVDTGFRPSAAFTTTTRAFRSGGLTKDAVYLRGLIDLLAHLADGGDLDLLWLGKLSLVDLPLVRDLAERGVLTAPRLLPRYLEGPAAAARLEQARRASEPTDLIAG